jgi:endogenous inhibitor of DNA gyrase (YacG/DUF329 family)
MASTPVSDGDTVPCSNCGDPVVAHEINPVNDKHLKTFCPSCRTTDVYLRDDE